MLFKDFKKKKFILVILDLFYNGENDAIMNPRESLCNCKLRSRWFQSFHKMTLGKIFFFISKLYGHVIAFTFLFLFFFFFFVIFIKQGYNCLEFCKFLWKSNEPWGNELVKLRLIFVSPPSTLLSVVLFPLYQWYEDWLSSATISFIEKYRLVKHFLRKSTTFCFFVKTFTLNSFSDIKRKNNSYL